MTPAPTLSRNAADRELVVQGAAAISLAGALAFALLLLARRGLGDDPKSVAVLFASALLPIWMSAAALLHWGRSKMAAACALTAAFALGVLLPVGSLMTGSLPRIAVPTLLIWGELDARSPLAVAQQFERDIPDARLVVIPDCGHVSNIEQPEQVNTAVREFLTP